jgi:hypothetical protein
MTEERIIQLELILTLPDTIARGARERGLLTAEMLESLITAEVKRQRVEQFFAAADRLAALPTSPLTEAEVETEIQAVRKDIGNAAKYLFRDENQSCNAKQF